jgi:hypothetical protein
MNEGRESRVASKENDEMRDADEDASTHHIKESDSEGI